MDETEIRISPYGVDFTESSKSTFYLQWKIENIQFFNRHFTIL